MKSHFEKYRLVLIFGLVFVLLGTTLLVALLSPLDNYTFLVFPSILLIGGMVILYFALLGKRRLFPIIVGLFLFSAWLFFLLVLADVLPYSGDEVWPAMVILSGLMLIPIAYIRYGFLPITFLLSAVSFVVLGSLFLLFSLDIIDMPFTQFASMWWPALIIVCGLALIGLFFYTRKNSSEKWIKDLEEDEDLQ